MAEGGEAVNLFEKLGARVLAEMFDVAAHGLALIDARRNVVHANPQGKHLLGLASSSSEPSPLLASIGGAERVPAQRWLDECLAGKPRKEDFHVVPEGGPPRTLSFFAVPVSLGVQATGLVAFHDVTESRRSEYERNALSRLASRLSLEVSVNDISGRLAEEVVSVTPGVASAVVLLADDPPIGRVAGACGLQPSFIDALESTLLREAGTLAERVPEAGQIHVITDLPRLYRSEAFSSRFTGSQDELRWETLVSVSLSYLGESRGALLTYFPPEFRPSETDLRFLKAIADQSVFAIENARLLSHVQDKAALEERSRLARELHDSVSQALYGIALGTRSAKNLLKTDPERVAERLDYVMKMAEAAVSEMRALIFELRPEVLEQEGLVMALAKLASSTQARHGLSVEARLGEEPRLRFSDKLALYRIAQEAVHNVVKHANAQKVAIVLDRDGNAVSLQVSDDGHGFDVQERLRGHFGLSSMRERSEALGGRFHIESERGRGTTVRVELPLGDGILPDSK